MFYVNYILNLKVSPIFGNHELNIFSYFSNTETKSKILAKSLLQNISFYNLSILAFRFNCSLYFKPLPSFLIV